MSNHHIASTYDHYAVLPQEIADRLMDRLSFFKNKPKSILEIACATGFLTEKLSKYYPDAQITAVDFSKDMIEQAQQRHLNNVTFITQDIFECAFRAGQFDAIIFNLFPENHSDLPRLFERCYAWLNVDGFLMFSTYGVDTLKELRTAFQAIDKSAHVNEFLDMHPMGDLLLELGFFEPVMNAEWVTLTYRNLHAFWEDLQGVGSRVFSEGKRLGLLTPHALKLVEATYDDLRVDNLYPATYEINYGMARKRAEQPLKEGIAKFPVEQLVVKSSNKNL